MIVLIALEIYEHKFQCLKSIDSLVLLQKKKNLQEKIYQNQITLGGYRIK